MGFGGRNLLSSSTLIWMLLANFTLSSSLRLIPNSRCFPQLVPYPDTDDDVPEPDENQVQQSGRDEPSEGSDMVLQYMKLMRGSTGKRDTQRSYEYEPPPRSLNALKHSLTRNYNKLVRNSLGKRSDDSKEQRERYRDFGQKYRKLVKGYLGKRDPTPEDVSIVFDNRSPRQLGSHSKIGVDNLPLTRTKEIGERIFRNYYRERLMHKLKFMMSALGKRGGDFDHESIKMSSEENEGRGSRAKREVSWPSVDFKPIPDPWSKHNLVLASLLKRFDLSSVTPMTNLILNRKLHDVIKADGGKFNEIKDKVKFHLRNQFPSLYSRIKSLKPNGIVRTKVDNDYLNGFSFSVIGKRQDEEGDLSSDGMERQHLTGDDDGWEDATFMPGQLYDKRDTPDEDVHKLLTGFSFGKKRSSSGHRPSKMEADLLKFCLHKRAEPNKMNRALMRQIDDLCSLIIMTSGWGLQSNDFMKGKRSGQMPNDEEVKKLLHSFSFGKRNLENVDDEELKQLLHSFSFGKRSFLGFHRNEMSRFLEALPFIKKLKEGNANTITDLNLDKRESGLSETDINQLLQGFSFGKRAESGPDAKDLDKILQGFSFGKRSQPRTDKEEQEVQEGISNSEEGNLENAGKTPAGNENGNASAGNKAVGQESPDRLSEWRGRHDISENPMIKKDYPAGEEMDEVLRGMNFWRVMKRDVSSKQENKETKNHEIE